MLRDCVKLSSALLMCILNLCAAISLAQSGQELPIVKSGEMPLYPPLPRLARIEGDVQLRVTTDGSGVSSIAVQSGQLMLARSAQDNVKTWKFVPHKPTVFVTLFSFRITKEESCKHDDPDNGEVILRLPTYVQITTRALVHAYCDPDAGLDLSEPLRVFLTSCEIDGSHVPCEQMKIQLHSGTLSMVPQRFKESDGKQGFFVPKEFRSLKTVDVNVDTGGARFTLASLDGHFLKGEWRVGIDHAPFKEDTGLYSMPDTVRCAGFVHFEWGEPEAMVWSRCN